MKMILPFAVLMTISLSSKSQQLVKRWETPANFKVPESVYCDQKRNVLYVSNIDGKPDAKDNKGSIGKLKPDGSIISVDWVTGLNAPKGIAVYGNTLYVSDIDEIAEIDLNTAKITHRTKVEGAAFLNDVAAAPNGDVYVSDSKTGKIHLLKKGTVETYLEGLESPNGVLVEEGKLFFVAKGKLYSSNGKNDKKLIAEGMDEATDGLEQTKNGDFVVTSWSGVIYYVKKDGTVKQLLDTRPEKINSADIGWDKKNQIVYVPTFFKNSVAAYQLQ